MSIKVDNPNNPGQEIEVFTADEVAAKAAEVETAKNAELETAKGEAEKYKRVASEQTTNFKKFSELNEAEKAKLSSDQIEVLKRAEAAEARVTALEEGAKKETQTRIETDTATALAKYHGGNAELKKALEDNFKVIALEGNDTATIQKKAEMAANMYRGSQAGRVNPLTASMNGGSPLHKDKTKTAEFLESDKAKEAMKRMGA